MVNSNSGKDYELAMKFWQILSGQSQIALNVLKEVLSAIMKLPFDPLINSQIDFSKLHETFKSFYLNKMSIRKLKIIPESYSYRPKLSELSMKIAKRQRNYDLKEQRSKHEANLIETVRKVITDVTKECTFKPKINRVRSTRNKTHTARNYRNRCNSLYDKAKAGRKKVDRKTEEIEYEKQKDELTFAPRIIKSNRKATIKDTLTGQGIEQSIERIQRGRKVNSLSTY